MAWGDDQLHDLEETDRDPVSRKDPRREALMLRLKKRRDSTVLKKILEDGGYADLAKMVRITKEDVD